LLGSLIPKLRGIGTHTCTDN